MMLPWRRAPFPIPKDLKGNDMYEPPPSPPSPPRKSVEKAKKNQRKIDYYLFTHETRSSTSKKEHRVNSGSPSRHESAFATNIKGGSFDRKISNDSPEALSSQKFRAQKGSLSNSARAANIKYPVYQPNFSPPEPPPPPPPPKNKYKVTLGTKSGTNTTNKDNNHLLRKDIHSPRNDILRVQTVGEYGNDPYLHMQPNSPRDKRNIIENKNRPVLLKSNSGALTVSDSR